MAGIITYRYHPGETIKMPGRNPAGGGGIDLSKPNPADPDIPQFATAWRAIGDSGCYILTFAGDAPMGEFNYFSWVITAAGDKEILEQGRLIISDQLDGAQNTDSASSDDAIQREYADDGNIGVEETQLDGGMRIRRAPLADRTLAKDQARHRQATHGKSPFGNRFTLR